MILDGGRLQPKRTRLRCNRGHGKVKALNQKGGGRGNERMHVRLGS